MQQALIFNIQRFCLHDGPGIRTTLFFKGCPLRCAWCQNPESIDSRPQIVFIARRCQSCFRCEEACERGAILRLVEKRIDRSRCDECGRCVQACPTGGLTRLGRRWTVAALVTEVLKDRDFFIDSGGGITLSGGEAMQQWRFLQAFLPVVKAQGIHVTLETCGLFDWHKMPRLLAFLDLIYFDLKHMDNQYHRRYTGVDNEPILKNFIRLNASAATLVPRMPIVPGITDTTANIAATARFLQCHGHATIHGLPFNSLGADKRRWIDSPLPPLNLADMDTATCRQVEHQFAQRGINAIIYD